MAREGKKWSIAWQLRAGKGDQDISVSEWLLYSVLIEYITLSPSLTKGEGVSLGIGHKAFGMSLRGT